MVSYFKTQWFRVLVAVGCFVMTLVYVLKPSPDTSTLEGLDTMMTYSINACFYFVSFLLWIFISFIDHNSKRIELLEKKQERDDAMYNLVQELVTANKIDREHIKNLEARNKVLEEKQK